MIQNAGFTASTHGEIGCPVCHAGNPKSDSKDGAHTGMIAAPSQNADVVCGSCHAGTTGNDAESIHRNLNGYLTMIELRSGGAFDPDNPAYAQKYQDQCAKCHTSCGQCHVSRPASVGGGFLDGHGFVRTPSITNNCTACHGSRVGEEYLGQRAGYKADVHWNPNAQTCVYCHESDEMHASAETYDDRYDVAELPRCEECHGDDAGKNVFHDQHWADLQCHTCHAQEYKNCYNCHAGEGLQEPSTLGFKIGRNPRLSEQHPYRYAVLRHVPIHPETFSDWGLALPNYSAAPTWRYATPHNIRLTTPQTDTTGVGNCYGQCHNSETLFLRAADLRDFEIEANQGVIVPDGPMPWTDESAARPSR